MQGTTLVYDRGGVHDFLAARVFEDHRVLPAHPEDTAWTLLDVIAALPPCPRLLFHLNATWTTRWPLDRGAFIAALERAGIVVLNARVTDISKRALMDVVDWLSLPNVRLSGDETDRSIVIVKTDANYGGRHDGSVSRDLAASLLSPGAGNPGGYIVGPLRELHPDVLTSPALVVQRYVENARGRFMRAYLVAGRMVVTLARSDKSVKKLTVGVVRTNFPITPDACLPPAISNAARAARAVAGAMGLDFGTVDIALDENDRPYVIDVNTTPYWGRETQGDILAHLRQS